MEMAKLYVVNFELYSLFADKNVAIELWRKHADLASKTSEIGCIPMQNA